VIYHRIETSTQTPEDARRQVETSEIWGQASRYSDSPKVKAYVGPLPEGKKGVEFDTDVPSDPGCPPGQAHWTPPREGVRLDGEWAKLSVVDVRNRQAD
jgi:hypothetical protein